MFEVYFKVENAFKSSLIWRRNVSTGHSSNRIAGGKEETTLSTHVVLRKAITLALQSNFRSVVNATLGSVITP